MTEESGHQEQEQELSTEEILAQVAQATEAAKLAPPHDPHPRKERKPKAEKAPREPKPPKEPKPAKLYPQWNEDGTPQLDAEGNQVQGEVRMKKPKAPKAPRIPKVKDPSQRSRGFPATATIHLLVEGNPKRGAARERFALYVDGMTVGEAKDAGVLTADLAWDTDRNLIRIDVPSQPEEAAPAQSEDQGGQTGEDTEAA